MIEIIAYTSMLVDHLGCTIIEHNAFMVDWSIGMAFIHIHGCTGNNISEIFTGLDYRNYIPVTILIFGHPVCFSILIILLIIELIHRKSFLQAAVLGVVSFFFFPSSGIQVRNITRIDS